MDVANSYLLRSCKKSLQNTLYFVLGKKDKINEFWKLDTDHALFIDWSTVHQLVMVEFAPVGFAIDD